MNLLATVFFSDSKILLNHYWLYICILTNFFVFLENVSSKPITVENTNSGPMDGKRHWCIYGGDPGDK